MVPVTYLIKKSFKIKPTIWYWLVFVKSSLKRLIILHTLDIISSSLTLCLYVHPKKPLIKENRETSSAFPLSSRFPVYIRLKIFFKVIYHNSARKWKCKHLSRRRTKTCLWQLSNPSNLEIHGKIRNRIIFSRSEKQRIYVPMLIIVKLFEVCNSQNSHDMMFWLTVFSSKKARLMRVLT